MLTALSHLTDLVTTGSMDQNLSLLYGSKQVTYQRERYFNLLKKLNLHHPQSYALLASAPGRTELGGNHTDHNNGNVLAAAVDLDCVAAISPLKTDEVVLQSDGYSTEIRVDLNILDPQHNERGTAEALVRGIASQFYKITGNLRGFTGYISATCKPGTGLSSSAAFAVLIGGIFNLLTTSETLSADQLAQMARKAENDFFGKPCGLMDQMSSSIGGTLAIDFIEPEHPKVERISFPDGGSQYRLMVIDTGGSHIELTDDYAAVTKEIKQAVAIFGNTVARGLRQEEIIEKLPLIREKAGDRAALRLMHFIGENERAVQQAEALKKGSFDQFLHLVRLSGESSALQLQNCSSQCSTREQGILLALALTKIFCPEAVARVHGGGFAGTVQVYIPNNHVESFTIQMEHIFGEGSVIPLLVGRPGFTAITPAGLLPPPIEHG